MVASMRSKVVILLAKNAVLGRTRDLLLPKLISGELALPAVDPTTDLVEA